MLCNGIFEDGFDDFVSLPALPYTQILSSFLARLGCAFNISRF